MFGLNQLKNHPKAALFAVATLVLASTSSAQANHGPFASMAGTWSGQGTITLASGAKEAIRCKATYNVDGSGSNLGLLLRCASASYKFELQSNVNNSHGTISGTWAELTNRVGGTISGSMSGGRIQALVEGTLAARLAMNTNATTQTISIESPGSPMSFASISLSRGAK
jgi:hypothetical protein